MEGGRVSTGLVIAGAYADKLRRTLFAQLSQKIKSGEVASEEVARASRELNSFLYHILVDRLKVAKDDVVRIRADYTVEDGAIRWNYGGIEIEVYRKSREDVGRVVEEALKHLEEVVERRIKLREAGRTSLGDIVYELMIGDAVVGALQATRINDELLVRGAAFSPEPTMIEGARIGLGGKDPGEVLAERVEELLGRGRKVGREEAEKAVSLITSMIRREAEAKNT